MQYSWGGLFIASLSVLALWLVPRWQVSSLKTLTPDVRFDKENESRKTLAQVIGGLFVIGSLIFTARTLQVSQEQAATAAEQVRIAQEGQFTDRFTKAIDQLGKKNQLELVLGGIYALARIANDSPKDHWPAMEVLTAYVRQNSPRQVQQGTEKKFRAKNTASIRQQNLPAEKYEEGGRFRTNIQRLLTSDKEKLPTDIQSILTVLSHRDTTNEHSNEVINLESTNLARAILWGANLKGAYLFKIDLFGANLRKSNLSAAFLEDSSLVGANLVEANLFQADLARSDLTFMLGSDDIGLQKPTSVNLREAKLYGAILRSALLDRADLRGAVLDGADLQGAHLRGANLQRATLFWADLRGAELTEANFYRAQLADADFRDASLWKANLTGANLQNAHFNWLPRKRDPRAALPPPFLRSRVPTGANLDEADLRDAHLEGANLQRATLIKADLRGAHLNGANFHAAKCDGADLRGVDLLQAQVDEAFGDKQTKLPAHITRPKTWN